MTERAAVTAFRERCIAAAEQRKEYLLTPSVYIGVVCANCDGLVRNHAAGRCLLAPTALDPRAIYRSAIVVSLLQYTWGTLYDIPDHIVPASELTQAQRDTITLDEVNLVLAALWKLRA